MDLFGAPMYFSNEPNEHKIKQLKFISKITNSKNPSNDIPLLDYFRSLEKWNAPLCKTTNILQIVFWRKNRVGDSLLPHWCQKYFIWNSVTLPSTLTISANDFVTLLDGNYALIIEIWAPKNVSDYSSILIKIASFSSPVVVNQFPLWEEAQILHYTFVD